MADFCSCGAELPPDALFCHKCGKPQRELTEVAVGAPTPVGRPLSEPVPPAPPDFRNPLALKIALLVAMGATALFWISPLNWPAAGYFAAFFYRRKTGSLLNVGAGARLGWITGLLAFVPAAAMLLVTEIPAAVSGRLAETYEEQMRSFPYQDPAAIQRVARFIATGPGIAAVIGFTLVTLFVLITCLSMAGGALAAKLGQASPPRRGSSA
jgi:hypothetical protein